MLKKIYDHYKGKCFIHKIGFIFLFKFLYFLLENLDNLNLSGLLEETRNNLNDSKIYN